MGIQAKRNLSHDVDARIDHICVDAKKNLNWLQEQMHPYFFGAMQDEPDAVSLLAINLPKLYENRRLLLADRDDVLILARQNRPGSLCETLRTLQEKEISYAYVTNSYATVPGLLHELEIQRFEFDRKSDQEISNAKTPRIPKSIRSAVLQSLKQNYPGFDFRDFKEILEIHWLNNEGYVRISSPRRIARSLWLYQQTVQNGGIYFDAEEAEGPRGAKETRIQFGVGNPPQREFLLQIIEIFRRLNIGVKRAACLSVSNGIHPYFLGSFCITTEAGTVVEKDTELYGIIQKELYNTQIISTNCDSYKELMITQIMSGVDASLVHAFIGFCHTNLAHNHPDRFDQEGIMRAFHNHPEIAQQLVKLFRARFDPTIKDRESVYQPLLEETITIIDGYNSGRRFLDDFRRTIFRCCLAFIRNTLKTNFFVREKHALAFRIDPTYLQDLNEESIEDLPLERPFRVTFFCSRNGLGYHIGFSDIARGGWRTIITRGRDDYVTCANTIFKENYVLAHTQHLKNKDIYEGGSKMVAVMNADNETDPEVVKQRLYKLQFGFINAFFDIYLTEDGIARHPQVVDYYREDEPIELGPDENMHDAMVESIARQAVKRGYMLGAGIMSSKQVGINHKEYGVTSTGVVKFADVTLEQLGIDMRTDAFSVKFTGGPNGDVAGNAMLQLLQQCDQIQIRLIIDGTGALYDPSGAERMELQRILLKEDLDAFNPESLTPGGFILYRGQTRMDGIRRLYKKVLRTATGLEEQWISNDEFYREYDNLIFTVPTDLFIPAGGRPETIDAKNCVRLVNEDKTLQARAIVEGANSYITPEARIELQKHGIIIIRDASANKCGVISSSYEIIANLLLTEKEFLNNKQAYVAGVIDILEKRAEDEARLIFRRHGEAGGTQLYTEISDSISIEINNHYARLFNFFNQNPSLSDKPLYTKAILVHLPELLRNTPRFRKRINQLPQKYKSAILASEIASSMIYQGDQDANFVEMVEGHLKRIDNP